MRWKSESGQAATENLAVISVLVIAIVGATYTFVPTFADGVGSLASDAKEILTTGKVGETGTTRGSDSFRTGRDPEGRGGGTDANAGTETNSASSGGSNVTTINNGPKKQGPGNGAICPGCTDLGVSVRPTS